MGLQERNQGGFRKEIKEASGRKSRSVQEVNQGGFRKKIKEASGRK